MDQWINADGCCCIEDSWTLFYEVLLNEKHGRWKHKRARRHYNGYNRELKQARFCQNGRQPEVNRVVMDGEWWRQPFSFEINNGSHSAFTFVILNENGWRHHSPSITTRFTSGWRPCWQKRRLVKLSNGFTKFDVNLKQFDANSNVNLSEFIPMLKLFPAGIDQWIHGFIPRTHS